MTIKRKISLTIIFLVLVGMLGSAYQYYYIEERAEFERAIRAYYLKNYGAEVDRIKLRHWAILALDRYGPTELMRSEEDYNNLFKEITQ